MVPGTRFAFGDRLGKSRAREPLETASRPSRRPALRLLPPVRTSGFRPRRRDRTNRRGSTAPEPCDSTEAKIGGPPASSRPAAGGIITAPSANSSPRSPRHSGRREHSTSKDVSAHAPERRRPGAGCHPRETRRPGLTASVLAHRMRAARSHRPDLGRRFDLKRRLRVGGRRPGGARSGRPAITVRCPTLARPGSTETSCPPVSTRHYRHC